MASLIKGDLPLKPSDHNEENKKTVNLEKCSLPRSENVPTQQNFEDEDDISYPNYNAKSKEDNVKIVG